MDIELFVPGRVCLFGEHTDWAGSFRRFNSTLTPGRTIVVGTNAGLHATVRAHPSSLIISTTTDAGERKGPLEIPMNPKALLAVAAEGGFWSYVAGVSYKIMTDYRVNGIVIDNYKTDLPLKKGLSSSAAICVLVARAFNRVYNLNMTTRGEMEYAYQGELVTPSRCGRMDQACAFGSRPVVMTYDGEFVDVTTLQVPKPLHLVIVDLCAKKDTVEILSKLQSCFPFAKTEDESNVQKLLGPINADITTEAIAAIECGDVEKLGALMVKAQALFDAYAGKVCPSQLTAPILHKVLQHAAIQPHVYGGKGVGAGGDGTAQLLVKSQEAQAEVARILESDFGMPCLFLTVTPSQPVTKAIIPAAGFDAEMFPATRCTRPELFPIFDKDDVVKPAIVVQVNELLQAGIQDIYVIVQPSDAPMLEKLFHERLEPSNLHKLTPEAVRHANALLETGKHVHIITQERQEGLGHAVLTAKDAVGDQPFLLMIGHNVYRSALSNSSCSQQILQQYGRSQAHLVGLQTSPRSSAATHVCASGSRLDTDEEDARAVKISSMLHKPSPSAVSDWQTDSILTSCGIFVLRPSIFPVLEDMVKHNKRSSSGDFQLTAALEAVRGQEDVHGYVIQGQKLNLNHPEEFVAAVTAFKTK